MVDEDGMLGNYMLRLIRLETPTPLQMHQLEHYTERQVYEEQMDDLHGIEQQSQPTV